MISYQLCKQEIKGPDGISTYQVDSCGVWGEGGTHPARDVRPRKGLGGGMVIHGA